MSIVDRMFDSGGSPNTDGWRLLKQSDNRFWFCLGGGLEPETNGCDAGLATTVTSQTKVVPGVWYNVVARKTAGRISIYVNGRREGTTTLGPFFDDNTADVLVGANDPEGAHLNGVVGEVAIYRRALSPDEIRTLFETSRPSYAR